MSRSGNAHGSHSQRYISIQRCMVTTSQDESHLDALKSMIDSPAGDLDFSLFMKRFREVPSDDVYRKACRYAHVRFPGVYEYSNWLYEDVGKMQRQILLNKAKAGGGDVKMGALVAVNARRLEDVPRLRIGDETWIQSARKGQLQAEMRKALDASRLLEAERDRLLPLSQDASEAGRAGRG